MKFVLKSIGYMLIGLFAIPIAILTVCSLPFVGLYWLGREVVESIEKYRISEVEQLDIALRETPCQFCSDKEYVERRLNRWNSSYKCGSCGKEHINIKAQQSNEIHS